MAKTRASQIKRQDSVKKSRSAIDSPDDLQIESTIDQWFEQQDHDVEKIHRSLRFKRSRCKRVIDEIELGRRVSKQIAEEEKEFVDAVILARNIARIETPENKDYGYDLVVEGWNDIPGWFREMYARVDGTPRVRPVPGKRAAFTEFKKQVRDEIETQMRAELEAAQDQTEMEEMMTFLLQSELHQFANELELARLIYSRHPGLVTAPTFPEPYRSSTIKTEDYDPETECCLSIEDLHITDPAEARRQREQRARQCVAHRRAMKEARRAS